MTHQGKAAPRGIHGLVMERGLIDLRCSLSQQRLAAVDATRVIIDVVHALSYLHYKEMSIWM
jgi:hypothetical protein